MGIGKPQHFAADVATKTPYEPRSCHLAANASEPAVPRHGEAQLVVPPPPPPQGLQRSKGVPPKSGDHSVRSPPRRSQRRRQASSRRQPKELSPGVFWSRGSKNHFNGMCRPCKLCHTPEGCSNGASCNFCHFKHDDVRMLEIEVGRLQAQLRRLTTKMADAEKKEEEAQTEEAASTNDTATEIPHTGYAVHAQVMLDQPPHGDIPASSCSLDPHVRYTLLSCIRMSL